MQWNPFSFDQALGTLRHLGLLGMSEGRLRPTRPESWSPSDLPPGDVSRTAADLHRSLIDVSAVALDQHRFNERHFGAVVTSLSESQYARVLARLREMERELVFLASESPEDPPNRVYALTLQLFPLSDYSDTGSD